MEKDALAKDMQGCILVLLTIKTGLVQQRTTHSSTQRRQIQPMSILTLPQSAQLLQ